MKRLGRQGTSEEAASILRRFRARLPHTRRDWGRAFAWLVAWTIILGMIGIVVGPAVKDLRSLGTHDWDQMESHRYLIYKSIRKYGQFPFWNPYGCGGHPSWGGIESGTAVVSPWLPFYLFAPLPVALKVELVGTAVLSAVGTWLLAGRFTRSAAIRVFCCAVFVVNGRWALQAAAGHTWHLYYAWTPWTLYFFDRASGCSGRAKGPRPPTRWRDVVLGGACIAMMVYTGAIYPLPQTIVILGSWACLLAVYHRTLRPIGVALASGVVAFGLSAPKLLPVLEVVRRFPRLVDSTEVLDLGSFVVIFTSRDQGFDSRPAPVNPYGWHEWGIYIGWFAFIAIGVGVVFARARREVPLKWVGIFLVVLGFGAFHEYAPWTKMHLLPIFKSQHVPSRWLYPATLVLSLVFASMLDRLMARLGRARPPAELILLAGAAWVSWDIAHIARLPMAEMFGSHMPKVEEHTADFHTEAHVSPAYSYDGISYGIASLPSEIANVGEVECMIFPGLGIFARDAHGVVRGLGAKGQGDKGYRGEAYTASGKGRATIEHFTPNAMTVRVENATQGDLVVLNQNWDSGWRGNGVPAVDFHDLVATPIQSHDEKVVFRYRPRLWWPSLAIFAVTAASIAAAFVLRRRARRRRTGVVV
jgi:hypothetical protein